MRRNCLGRGKTGIVLEVNETGMVLEVNKTGIVLERIRRKLSWKK